MYCSFAYFYSNYRTHILSISMAWGMGSHECPGVETRPSYLHNTITYSFPYPITCLRLDVSTLQAQDEDAKAREDRMPLKLKHNTTLRYTFGIIRNVFLMQVFPPNEICTTQYFTIIFIWVYDAYNQPRDIPSISFKSYTENGIKTCIILLYLLETQFDRNRRQATHISWLLKL